MQPREHAVRPDSLRRIVAMALVAAAIPAIALMPGDASITFTQERVTGSRGYEQGINVGPDGTIFVDEPSGLGAHSKLWRWDTGTASFKQSTFPTPYGRYPGGGDSDVVIAPGGRVYFLDLWAGSNSVAASDDNGTTWTRGSPITTLPISDRQWLALGPRDPETGLDTIHAYYVLVNPPRAMMTATSRDGGATWLEHKPTLPDVLAGPFGKPVSDANGFMAFTYTAGNKLRVARTDDDGATWEGVEISRTSDVKGDLYGLAHDTLRPENLYAVWTDTRNHHVRLSYSRDRGTTWKGFPAVEISKTGSAVFPWVAARDGKVAVAWYETDAEGGPDAAPAGSVWRLMYAESLDDGTTWSDPVVVDDKVKTGVVCTSGLSCTSGREVGDFLQLQIDQSQRSVIAYYNLGPGYVAFQN